MNIKSSSSNIARFPTKKEDKPQSPYLDFVRELRDARLRPLRLIIDCERYGELLRYQNPLVEHLGQELQLWASILGQRPIHALYLLHPYRYLQPFELTRLLHVIASRFRVDNTSSRRYAIISGIEEITSEHLALVKGLGFNCYQIIVSDPELQSLKKLSKKIALIRDYAIESIGVQMLHPDCLGEIREHIREIQTECHPDYICLGKAWDSSEVVYSTHEYERFDWTEEGLDVLELGPEGTSVIDELKIQNYCSSEKYRAALDVGRLPIHAHTPHINM